MSNRSTGRNLPLFAQPVNGSKFPTPLTNAGKQGAALLSRPLAWTVAVITCGALLSLSRPNNAQNIPSARNTTQAVQPAQNRASNSTSSNGSANSTSTTDLTGAARRESRRSIDFYTQAVRGNMFTAPTPPASPIPKVVVTVTPTPKPVPIPVPAPAEINPFAEWSYTGTIKSDDQITGLIENTRTKEGQFVKAGDMFMGSQVATITDQEIVLKAGKTSRALAKSDNITVTPLDRSAIPTNPQGQPQAGQQPNAAQMIQQAMQAQMSGMDMSQFGRGGRNRGGNGGGNGQTFTLPNGRQLNQQQFQRRSQNLNQNFNQ